MLPGRRYSPEVIARLAWRRAWIILFFFSFSTVLAVAVSKALPNQYQSTTVIMLVRQRIPDSYVKTTVTERIEDRLTSLQEQILSRSRLERIILDLNLYESLRVTLPMEDVVQRMRDHIKIKTEGKESFRVTYDSLNARTAQKTTERLASLFIEENQQDRENVAEDTNQFLDSQLEDAKRRLLEHEKKLEEYRRRYSGELPSQANANLQAVQSAQAQLQTNSEATDRSRERRLLLERQIIDLQTPEPAAIPATPVPGAESTTGTTGESPEQQLEAAKSRLQVLLTKDKPDHPDVRALQRTIRDLEAKVVAQGAKPVMPVPEKPVTAAERIKQQRLGDLKAQIEEIDRQLAQKQEQEKRLHAVIADYQSKLEAVPKRESDLVELTRDYTTLQTSYQELLRKREESKIAANLERRNIGEQFRVLDPARVPERPYSPKRVLINAGGAVAGLALGLLLVALLEYRDSTFRSEEEVIRLCQLPVLAMVPLLMSHDEVRSRRRWHLSLGLAAVVLLATSVAAVMFWRPQL